MKGLYSFLGVAVCLACLGAVIKQLKPAFFTVYSVAALVVCFGYLAVLFAPVADYIKELTASTDVPQFFSLLFKAVGVSFLCSIASELCKACGETSLAGAVESAGKIVIMLLSLPVLKYLLEAAAGLAA